MEVKDTGTCVEEDMTLNEVDSVRNLLDRLKYDKERELKDVTSAGSSSVHENETSASNLKQDCLIGELRKKQNSGEMNLNSVAKNGQHETADYSKKRKQNEFSVEVQERAEVISKSARKGPATVVSSLTGNIEGDSDTEEFLEKIRAAPSAPNQTREKAEIIHTRVHRSKSASEVDLSVVVSMSSQLNLEAQKSKITVARSGSMKGRRKPTTSMRRMSQKSGFMDDLDDEGNISDSSESMDEEGTGTGLSGVILIFKDRLQVESSDDDVRPPRKPKPKVKSQTVAGIALPGLAEMLNKNNANKADVARPLGSVADIVRVAAEGKRKQAAKEERVEKEPDKPAWLVEAEARRKLHEQRRHSKTKQHEEKEQQQCHPSKGVTLRSVAERSKTAEVKHSATAGTNKHHNVVLLPVRKAEPVRAQPDDNNDASRAALNVRLRPVSKPVPKAESDIDTDRGEDANEHFHNVRLRPIVFGGSSSGNSKTTKAVTEHHAPRSLTPIASDIPMKRRTESKVSEGASSSSRSSGGGSRVTISSDYVSAPNKVATKTRTGLNNNSKTVTVTASEVPDPSGTSRRKSVEFVHTKVEWKGSSPTVASRNSHGDLRRGSHDRTDSSYRPSYTGDVLPQWKIDLMEKKKNIVAVPVRPPTTPISNTGTVPQWKKQLAEKRKQRVDHHGVQKTNKENEPKTSPETPQWKKEVAERRKRREMSPIGKKSDASDKPVEIPEWRKKLSTTRRPKSVVISESPIVEEAEDQVPSFMKEFEKKKKNRSRGGHNASYV